jgi:hypothetical protein
MTLNIYFLHQERSEYGQSFLYHGLCSLGHNVVPFGKNTFHFKRLKECGGKICHLESSPCVKMEDVGCLEHSAHLTLEEPYCGVNIFEHCDLLVTNNGWGNEELIRGFRDRGVKIAALDLGDSINSSYDAWKEVIGSKDFYLFRREYVEGQIGNPLSYSFYEEKSIYRDSKELIYNVSFLSRPTSPQRIKYIELMQSIPNSIAGTVPHSQYLDVLSRSKFSVAVRGAGFDTVRRWEIPARGSVLCLEEAPIVINNDFTDGLNCIKFSSPEELRDKINYYLNNSCGGYDKLRENCFSHFRKFHTTKERAKEFLKGCGF